MLPGLLAFRQASCSAACKLPQPHHPPAGLPELGVGLAQAEDELHGGHRLRAARQAAEQVARRDGERVVAVPHRRRP